ncbi:hypothetical protein D9M70_508980 [compost metagenome]
MSSIFAVMPVVEDLVLMASRRFERSLTSLMLAEIVTSDLPCRVNDTVPAVSRSDKTALVRASALMPVSVSLELTAAATSRAVPPAATEAVAWPSGPVRVRVVRVTLLPALLSAPAAVALPSMLELLEPRPFTA